MGLLFWDGVLSGGTAVLLVLLAWNFRRDRRRSQTAWLGLLLSLSALCYLFLPALPPEANGAPWRVPPHLFGMASPALFWLFAASWFDDDFEVRPWHWGIVAGCVIAGAVGVYVGMARDWPRWTMVLSWPVPSLVMTLLGIAAALRGRSNDLVETRRGVRLALALAIAALIIVIVVAELLVDGWPPAPQWRLVNAVALLATTFTVAISVFGWRDPALLAAPVRASAAPAAAAEADDSALLVRLQAEMTRERLYRQDGLTITSVAARLGVPEYRLRRAINQGLGARNFNAYLNSFRLAEAEQALVDASQREVPIVTIALDAGFGSLAPFNRAFRGANGSTPTEFRARALAVLE